MVSIRNDARGIHSARLFIVIAAAHVIKVLTLFTVIATAHVINVLTNFVHCDSNCSRD
jgi:hypothetical protein